MAKTTKTTNPRRAKPQTPLAPRAQRAQRRSAKATEAAASGGLTPSTNQSATRSAGPGGKLGVIVAMMRRPEGATVVQMSEATDWLPHSVRGALAGALKKKHKLEVTSEKTDAGRVYRIAPIADADQSAEPTAEPAAA
jgi:hypothetical protein